VRIANTTHGFAVAHPEGGWVLLTDLGIPAEATAGVIAAAGAVRAGLAGAPRGRDDLALACPVVRPSKVIAIGLNYLDHVRETGAAVPERPVVFAKFPSTLTAPGSPIVVDPMLTEEADYETELAVVIGRRARRVARADALDHVFGYAVANDVTARDWQRKDAQFDRAKGFDTFLPIGPWITTADEVADPQALPVRTHVNGELRQDSSTAEMVFGVAELIEFLSRGMTLEPGDVIITGTPHGVGFAMDPPRFLAPGDIVRCEIVGLGAIENPVVGPDPA
jgi:2-keto-4-pentenoate hydratase/2-oxohepta-3-ene-1,7-dioic acid hydratase in catechol pathway